MKSKQPKAINTTPYWGCLRYFPANASFCFCFLGKRLCSQPPLRTPPTLPSPQRSCKRAAPGSNLAPPPVLLAYTLSSFQALEIIVAILKCGRCQLQIQISSVFSRNQTMGAPGPRPHWAERGGLSTQSGGAPFGRTPLPVSSRHVRLR